jgi:Flp pilus assembly protein TadD
MAERYLTIKPDEAQAFAQMAWYRANLGETAQAHAMLAKAEALGTERGEVALWSAQVNALLGNSADARKQLERARAEGIPEQRIESAPALRRLTGEVASTAPSPPQG